MKLEVPVSLPLDEIVPAPGAFWHPSKVHGQEHVSRVMIHASLLLQLTEQKHLSTPLWASVYLHDLARTHDGRCYRHGADAARRFAEFQDVFAKAGLCKEDEHAVRTAVAWHSVPREMPRRGRYASLVHLLKDADGLDRVRIHDLDPRFLRYTESRRLVRFAHELFARTSGRTKVGSEYFPWLWKQAESILEELSIEPKTVQA